MTDKKAKGAGNVTGGLDPQVLAGEDLEDPGGAGGSSGGGTHAGRVAPSGGTMSGSGTDPVPGGAPPSFRQSEDEELEARALGDVNGTLADAGGKPTSPPDRGPVGAEAVGAGAGRSTGSGTPRDTGGLGGGGPLGEHGGTGPRASDGGE